jgi:Uma2 family endonuclease
MEYGLVKNHLLTFAEYEKLEAEATENRYEFEQGMVTDMAGGSKIHNLIIQNVGTMLRNHFRNKGCQVFTESVKLEVSVESRYYYPDILLTCSEADRNDNFLVKEPVLIVEVLSESTSRRDLGSKMDAYLTIPSLQAYVIIDQGEYWVRLHNKEENQWKLQPLLDKPEDVLHIPALNLSLSLSEIYLDVRFDSK